MFKKNNGFFVALMAGILFSACQSTSSSVDGDVQYLAVQTESDGKWGMVDSDGKLLFSDEFKNEPSAVVNGYFSVKEGEKYALYAASAKPELVSGCDDLTSVGVFKDGIIPVAHEKSRINFVDGKGMVKATLNPVGGKEITGCSPYSCEGLFVFYTEENKWGYVDDEGNVVIEPKYDEAGPFSEGIAIVKSEKKEETIYLAIDKKGKEVFRLKKDLTLESAEYSHGLLIARNADDQWGFLNNKGEFTKVGGKVKRIGEYNSDYYAFMNEEYLWGVMDMKGEVLIRPKFGSLSFLADGNFFVHDDDKYYIMDKKSEKLQTIEDYSYVRALNMGKFLYIAQDKSSYILLDKEAKPVGKEEFKGINVDTSATPGFVRSDYFNFDSVLQVLVGGLSGNGIDKYTLGMSVSQLGIEDYSSYTYEYEYRNPDLNKNGWRYEVRFGVRTDKSIAMREYYDYGSDSKIVLNPDAKVDEIYVSVESQVSCWNEIKDKIISEIQAKGYKIEDQGDSFVTFKGKDCELTLYHSSDGETIGIRLLSISNSETTEFNNEASEDTVLAEEVVAAPY